jgi:HEPN domain-containing protein
MTNLDMSHGHLRRAQVILREAANLVGEEAWNLVVRRAQEAVELSLKGVLRYLGLEVPHVHDLAAYLRRNQQRVPAEMQKNLDRLISISRRLSEERELSFYGDDMVDVPPEALYSRQDAEAALTDAQFVVQTCLNVVPKP